jgi:hypothetical protein
MFIVFNMAQTRRVTPGIMNQVIGNTHMTSANPANEHKSSRKCEYHSGVLCMFMYTWICFDLCTGQAHVTHVLDLQKNMERSKEKTCEHTQCHMPPMVGPPCPSEQMLREQQHKMENTRDN